MNFIKSLVYNLSLFFVPFTLAIESKNQPLKKALITGIGGQDGSYLVELLAEKGYQIHGLQRRNSSSSTLIRLAHLKELEKSGKLILHYGDVTDSSGIIRLISDIQPTEIYNLAAQSDVRISFDMPEYTTNTDAVGALVILEALRILGLHKKTKFYQASTSEMFGKVQEIPQTEKTPFYPRSPYAAAKLYAHWITVNYREAYGIYACSGILFNHESPRRGENFVTRKITQGVAKIKHGLLDKMQLGNLDSKRDWGYAKDYVEAMWLMLQQSAPQDYVIATGETHSVRSFLELAFKEVGVTIKWQGKGVQEVGIDQSTSKVLVSVDPYYFRPSEVELLIGDSTKARNELQWKPKTTLQDLVKLMVKEDLAAIEKELRKKGKIS